jgi:hypothetical protein
MRTGWFWRYFVLVLVLVMIFASAGCGEQEGASGDPEPDGTESGDVGEDEGEGEGEEDKPYFYPWISHSTLMLSTGEALYMVDLFESDIGYIGDFTPDYFFEGTLVWIVEESNVFDVEWLELLFDVDDHHYDTIDDEFLIEFMIPIEDFFDNNPASGPDMESYELNIVEHRQGFEIKISQITFAQNQEDFEGNSINYVAMQVEMRNVK